MFLLPLVLLFLGLLMFAAAWFGKRSLAVVLAAVLAVALIVVGSVPAGAYQATPTPGGVTIALYDINWTGYVCDTGHTCAYSGTTVDISGSKSSATTRGLGGGFWYDRSNVPLELRSYVDAQSNSAGIIGLQLTTHSYTFSSDTRPLQIGDFGATGSIAADNSAGLIFPQVYSRNGNAFIVDETRCGYFGSGSQAIGNINFNNECDSYQGGLSPSTAWDMMAFQAGSGAATFTYAAQITNIRWVVRGNAYTPTPTHTPNATPTPTDSPYTGAYGMQCEIDGTIYPAVSPTPGGPAVQASYIQDGSFEEQFLNIPPASPWYPFDGYAGTVHGDGVPYSRLGDQAIVQYYFNNTSDVTGFAQTVYLPADVDYIEIGFSVRGGETPGSRTLSVNWKNQEVWSDSISGVGWQDVGLITDSNGGLGVLEFEHDAGDGTVYVDAVYLYAWQEGPGGLPVIVCTEVIGTPTPLPSVPPLGTAGPTPTPGDIWATPIDPGGGTTPQATSCYGWPNVDYPDPPEIGGVDLPGEIPGVDLCIRPQLLVIGADNPIRQVMDPESFFLTLMGFGVVAAVISYVRQR